MHIYKVENDEHIEQFHQVPIRLYEHDKQWIPHVVKEIENIFSPEKNSGFQTGEAARWVLLNQNFELIGRIAAFYSRKEAQELIGGVGFYECENDPKAAKTLFQTAEKWLKSHGVVGADGPVNFGERHQFWGCALEKQSYPIYQENYNPTYYNEHFEANDYLPSFQSVTYQVDIDQVPYQRLEQLYQRIAQRQFTYNSFCMKEAEKYVENYLSIAQQSFDVNNRTVSIDNNTILEQLNVQRGVFKDGLIWFAYADGEPVGVLGTMLNWSGMLQQAITQDKSLSTTYKGFLIAVLPAYQHSGVVIGLMHQLYKALYREDACARVYLCGIASYSKNVHSIISKVNGQQVVVHQTYKKYFDH